MATQLNLPLEILDNSDFKLIGIAGKMGTGKNFISDIIDKHYWDQHKKVIQLCWADQLKLNVSTKENISLDQLYGNKKPEIRKKLQREGTEEGRMKIGEYIWINYVANWIKLFWMQGFRVFIIPDCRFENEVSWINQNKGTSILIQAPDRNHSRLLAESSGDLELYHKISTHPSEINLDGKETIFTYVINNCVDVAEDIVCQLNKIF